MSEVLREQLERAHASVKQWIIMWAVMASVAVLVMWFGLMLETSRERRLRELEQEVVERGYGEIVDGQLRWGD